MLEGSTTGEIVVLIIAALILIGMFGLGIWGLIWVARGTLNRTHAGINLGGVGCPRCGAAQPKVRKPANMRQFLWGGNTCPQCGLEMDKWGRPLA